MTMTFNPGVYYRDASGDRRYIECPGWMYVLAFALRGVEWAIEAADKPEFRQRVRQAIAAKEIEGHEEAIRELEAAIAEHKGHISSLKSTAAIALAEAPNV